MKPIPALCMMLGLAACQPYSLQELRQVEPTGSEFQQALAKEYMLLASQEEANYDWGDSWHFADKGLSAAYGNDVGPENVSDWDIAPEFRPGLEEARDKLLTALRPDIVSAHPVLAARAYRYYDCWIERQEDAWQTDKIAECKQGFHDALAELEEAAAPKPAAIGGDGVNTTSYIVFFEWNRASLTKTGLKVVDDVAAQVADEESYDIVLNGHTDTTGLEKFNLTLSKRRAETVAAALEARGIDRSLIKIFAFGESDPLVATADGVDEPKNRRVEIFIQ